MSRRLTLHYFDIHGLGARIRLSAAVGKVDLVDHRFKDREEFNALKTSGGLPFGQVPLLKVETETGVSFLPQSTAILRYICTLGGLHPTTDLLTAGRIDAALVAESDAFAAYGCIKYRDRNGFSALDATTVAATEKLIASDVIPRHLSHLEKSLAASKSGWICDTPAPAACDFAWGTQLRELRAGTLAFVPAELLSSTATPHILAFLDKFMAVPEVAAYYAAYPS